MAMTFYFRKLQSPFTFSRDCGKLLGSFVKSVYCALEKVSDTITTESKGRLKLSEVESHCHKCLIPKVDSYKGEFYTHCTQCIFPVTHTKMGACILFQWSESKLFEKEITLTVDVIPLFPIAAKTKQCKEVNVLKLQKILTKGLLEQRPSNWINHFKGHVKKDRVLPEAFKEQMDNDTLMIGIKLLNYGENQNCIIHPAQKLKIDSFGKHENLKKLYCVIKALKTMLSIDLSSYFIKKVILLKEFRKSIKTHKKFEWVMVKRAITETALKPYFENIIDFERWASRSHRYEHIPLHTRTHMQL